MKSHSDRDGQRRGERKHLINTEKQKELEGEQQQKKESSDRNEEEDVEMETVGTEINRKMESMEKQTQEKTKGSNAEHQRGNVA